VPRRKLPLRGVRRALEAPLVAGIALLASVLPRRAIWRLSGLLGTALEALPSRANRIVDRHRRNIMLPCGFDVRTRDVYRFLAAGILDFIHLSRRSDEEFRRAVEVEGAGHIAEALALGRGVLAITGHIGSWELIPRAVGLLGHRTGVVGRKLSGLAAEELISSLRARPGVQVIDRSSGATALVRALRGNTAVGILIDQDTVAVESGFVDFFGIPALTPLGPAKLAIRLGIPVVPLFIRRLPDGRHRLSIEPMVDPGGFAEPDGILDLTAFLTGRIEARVREDPRQWVWFHERWCRRPPGAPGLR
jgi:KDO2-lipid IV(A) lauroyltransferase